MCFPSSHGKESACNLGGLGLIPGREDPPEKEMATTPVFLAAATFPKTYYLLAHLKQGQGRDKFFQYSCHQSDLT